MKIVDFLIGYLSSSSAITFFVLALLSLYFILVNWIFIARRLYLSNWLSNEMKSLESLLMGAKTVMPHSAIKRCLQKTSSPSKELLDICTQAATKEATVGLTLLSLIASTSPFIGLFGTVVSILETFWGLGDGKMASIGTIAKPIGEALIATAAGIFVAIFSYSYHMLLKRKSYEVVTAIKMQSDVLIARSEQG